MCQQWDLALSVLISSSLCLPLFSSCWLDAPRLAVAHAFTIITCSPQGLRTCFSFFLISFRLPNLWMDHYLTLFNSLFQYLLVMWTSHIPCFNFSYSSYYGCLNNHQTLYNFIQKLFCFLISSRAGVGVSSLFLVHSSFGWGGSKPECQHHLKAHSHTCLTPGLKRLSSWAQALSVSLVVSPHGLFL